jgi:nucleoside-diphosphate kinase
VTEKTIVLVKPDGMIRGLAGQVTTVLENRGLTLVGCKLIQLTPALLREHYAHLVDKPFFPGLQAFMESAPVLAQCWQGRNAVDVVRAAIGATDGAKAAPGTIRGIYSSSQQCNVVHASEDAAAAEIEIKRFFQPGEIFEAPAVRLGIVLAADEA